MAFNPAGHHVNPTYRNSRARQQGDSDWERGEKILHTIRRQQANERIETAQKLYRDSSEPWKKVAVDQYKRGEREDFPIGHPSTHNNVARDANGRII